MNSTNRKAVFVGGMRTPFGRAFKGAYADVRPDDLMIELLTAQAKRLASLWSCPPDDLLVGCAYPEGEQGYNVARMIALGSGLDLPGATVNRLCASSMEVVAIAAARVISGWGDCYLVGGLESMSRIPRRGANFSESNRIKQRLAEAYIPNGDTAENVASRFPEIDRLRQEDFAARSHTLAFEAFENRKYQNQIHPFRIDRDEFIRYPVDRAKMASLEPAFQAGGTVTAATSSPLTDGASSGWVTTTEIATAAGFQHGLEIIDAAVAHVSPGVMGIGPVPATRTIFSRNKLSAGDIAAYEINEAFAVQVLASIQELNLPLDRVNTWGGAIAIGHPLGASGLRLVMTLHDRLAELDVAGSLGLATLCVGGGQGMSMLCRYVEL